MDSYADSSNDANPVSAIGGVAITSAQSAFGGKSLYVDGSSGYLRVTHPSTDVLGNGDFTVDFWAYNLTGANGVVFHMASDYTYGPVFGYLSSGHLYTYLSSSGSGWEVVSALDMGAAPGAEWDHYAVVRSGNTFFAFRNGTQISTATSSATVWQPGYSYSIGAWPTNGPYYIGGYIDELRVIKGVALWTSNFTPPTAPTDPCSTICPRIASGSQFFTASGTFTPPSGVSTACPLTTRILAIGGGGGGGGGGSGSAGGGGSGYVVAKEVRVTGALSVVIGTGGAAATSGSTTAGTSGTSTTIASITATGGVASGGAMGSTGGAGGSGGGCGGYYGYGAAGYGGTNGSAGSSCVQGTCYSSPGAGQGTIVSATNNVQGVLFQTASFSAAPGGQWDGGAFYEGAGYGGGGRGGMGGGGGGGGLYINGGGRSSTGYSGNGANGAVFIEW